ncbi:alpha/beta hydrolase [Pantoea stewartii]|uniref:alpha/beta hydrolase n=1 Tax=Pantoea stewartii TaxID=66269 RepID=UPI00162699AB|nr:alpha/beta hydrolase [Pantoea stewartii]MBC0856509.1 alpha/beta hydrolase [Pantoea stewartii]
MTKKFKSITLPQRILLVPNSISPEAKEAMNNHIGLDGLPRNFSIVMPSPDDLPAWKKMQDQAEKWYNEFVKKKSKPMSSTIDTKQLGEATLHIATPKKTSLKGKVLIDLHGGALVFGGGSACRDSTRLQADQYEILCYGIDYRMPPEFPYPAALDDCLTIYRHVLEQYRAEDIVICGRSAGGNLASAMLIRAYDEGLPAPAALILLSPQVDLTESGDSFQHNRLADVILPDSLMANNLLYAAGVSLTHPYISPLFADLSKGFPPTFLQSGTRDLFLSNTVRMHRELRRASVYAELHVFEAMPHGGFGGAPEDIELTDEILRFIQAQLSTTSAEVTYNGP